MKHRRVSNRGQVLIIFVFAVVGLIGITGLAIDGSNIFSDRRHAQNAADTASLAASLYRAEWIKGHGRCDIFSTEDPSTLHGCQADIVTRAMDIALKNGYSSDIVHSRVDVYSPPIDGPYSEASFAFDRNDYVEVAITSHVDTWFARVLGITQTHNRVWAVTKSFYQPSGNLYGGNSLVELRPTSGPGCGNESGGGGGDVYLGGSSGMILDGGGIFVNSNNPDCSLKITNTCPQIQLLNGATVEGMGGQFPGCTPPLLNSATDGYPYPPPSSPVSPIPPLACNKTPRGVTYDADGVARYYPGHYDRLPPERDVRLDHGVYCVDQLIKTTNSYRFYADGVFMYVKAGGNFSFNGGTIQLVAPGMGMTPTTPPAPVDAETAPYKGYLIYVDENNWGPTAPDCTVNGASDTILRGVIYAPHCDVKIDGGSGTFGITAQVIAYTLNLQGNAVLNFVYEADKMPGVPELLQVTLSR